MVAQLPATPSYRKQNGDDFVWLYGSDLWIGEVNEGKAGSHWEPLTFTENGDILPLNCYVPAYEVEAVTTKSQAVDIVADATVSSAPGDYTWTCGFGIRNRNFIYQFFRAPKGGVVSEFGVNVAQQQYVRSRIELVL